MSPKKSPKAVVTSATDEQQLSRRATERWTLKDAADELSKQFHEVMSPADWLAVLEELVPAELVHSPGGEVQADELNALLDAHPRWKAIGTPHLPSARQVALRTVYWFDGSMHAAHWFDMAAPTPREAASILSQSDPLDERLEPENTTTDETGPGDFGLLHRVFLDVERSDPGCRTLLEWLKIARARGCKHHSWIDKYLEAREKLGSPVGSIKVKPGDAPKVTAGGISKVPNHGGDMKHESLLGLIELYADGPFDKLPDDLRQRVIEAFDTQSAAFDAQQWNALPPNKRRAIAQEWDLVQQIETQAAYDETGLNGGRIDWRYWAHQITTWSAAEACRLMSALDPDIFITLNERPGIDDPSLHCQKAGKIQRLAEREGTVNATPSEWLAWAVEKGIHVHAGLRVQVLPEQNTAAPAVAAGKKWTPEKLSELRAYRDKHTMPETAKAFGITEQRIRRLLPTKKAPAKPFAGLIHRTK